MRLILFLLTGFFVTFSSQRLKACGFSVWGEEYRYHLMFPEMLGKSPIMPFHFSSSYWYSDPFEFEELGIEKNSAEWSRSEGNKHAPTEWARALYDVSYGQIQALEDTFIRQFLSSLSPDHRSTFLYVKKLEGLFEDYSPWVSENRFTEPNRVALAAEGRILYERVRSKDLKCRIAYQLIRLAPDSSLLGVADTFLEPVRNSSITGDWALRQLAGYYQRKHDDARANLLLAQLFIRCDEWKYWAFENYQRNILSETLTKAETREEKEAILVLDALKVPGKGMKKLKELYQLNPDNPLMEMLVMREINKMEDLIYTPAFTGGNAPAVYGWWYGVDEKLPGYFENKMFARQLRQFVWNEAVHKKSKSAFWNLAAAYLAMLDDALPVANSFLLKSRQCADFNSGIEIQWLTLTALYQAKDKTYSPIQRRENVVASFLKLKKELGFDKKAASVLSNLAIILAHTFHESGDQVMAAYCFGHVKHYHAGRFFFSYYSDWSSGQVDEWYEKDGYFTDNWAGSMQFFFYLEKEAPTEVIEEISYELTNRDLSAPMQKFMAPVLANNYRVYDLLGTRYFVESKYCEALKSFKKVPDSWWDTCKWEVYKHLPDNPFYGPIEFIQSPIAHITCKTRSTKSGIADSMCRWNHLQATSSGNEAAVYQFKMANLILNTTYAGEAWAMSRYWKSGEHSEGEYGYSYKSGIEKQLDADYFNLNRAKLWYKRAYQNSQDPLMRASCLARAAYCEDETPFFTVATEVGRKGIRMHLLPPSLQRLLKEYPEMAASIYAGCPDFDAFFGKK